MRNIGLWLFLALCGPPAAISSDSPATSRLKSTDHDKLPGVEKSKQMSSAKAGHDLTQRQNRRLIGRHVCAHNKVVMLPVKDLQSYCKPSYKSYLKRCDKDSSQYCTGYRVAYELSYRTVQRLLAKTESVYSCCPGWALSRSTATDCKKAVCKEACRNGGICSKPDRCACPTGWTGRACETDVDECSMKSEKCHHVCVNVPGSYKCECESGYVLQTDKKSCKKIRTKVVDKREFSDKNEDLSERMETLEKRMKILDDLNSRMDTLSSSVQQIMSKKTRESGDNVDEEVKRQTKDQIESLSDQIAILEERLAECSCNKKESLLLPTSNR